MFCFYPCLTARRSRGAHVAHTWHCSCHVIHLNLKSQNYVRLREVGLARKVFDGMREKDLVSWNTMIHGYASVGDVAGAKRIFDMTAGKDVVSWSSMIAAYAKSRQSNETLRLFYEMQLENVVPDRITMVSVLSACGDAGALGMGKMAHEFIVRNKIGVDLKLGTALVDMYARCGDMDSSTKAFDEMEIWDFRFRWMTWHEQCHVYVT